MPAPTPAQAAAITAFRDEAARTLHDIAVKHNVQFHFSVIAAAWPTFGLTFHFAGSPEPDFNPTEHPEITQVYARMACYEAADVAGLGAHLPPRAPSEYSRQKS
jgi:hypothetical protein